VRFGNTKFDETQLVLPALQTTGSDTCTYFVERSKACAGSSAVPGEYAPHRVFNLEIDGGTGLKHALDTFYIILNLHAANKKKLVEAQDLFLGRGKGDSPLRRQLLKDFNIIAVCTHSLTCLRTHERTCRSHGGKLENKEVHRKPQPSIRALHHSMPLQNKRTHTYIRTLVSILCMHAHLAEGSVNFALQKVSR
jgi:hypothetical protein